MKFSDILRNIIPGKNNKPATDTTNHGQRIAGAIAETELNLQQTINNAVQDRINSPESVNQLVQAVQAARERNSTVATKEDVERMVTNALADKVLKGDMNQTLKDWKNDVIEHIGTFMNQSKTIAKKNFNLN